jgi:spore maturation protein CgeB
VKFALFYHSLVSDWNHGNAHFLRGIAAELLGRGHRVDIYEPHDSWSYRNLVGEYGQGAVEEFERAFPLLRSRRYHLDELDPDVELKDADVVLVHEWNEPELVRRIGEHRGGHPSYRLFFHDTHHRAATEPEAMSRFELTHYDGVLAYGRIISQLYLDRGWAKRAWTWHEAADTRIFKPHERRETELDLVWIGNWGDDERTAELHEFLIEPVRRLGIRARVYGVRYPREALDALRRANIEYGGWIANHRVPGVFARSRLTIHIPRRPYREQLPGIPTIRPFEALACGIPLISAPWLDSEQLFTPGDDYLISRNGGEMTDLIRLLLNDGELARRLAEHGRTTIEARHTCAHRVDQLLEVCA